MFFSVDPNGDVAIYEQIVRQVKFAIAEGSLQPRQILPSARQLSGELAVNPNTVARYAWTRSPNVATQGAA
jgi:GntR family transcriptional regulator